jgi:nucleoside-diphosphate-sugar epimerase
MTILVTGAAGFIGSNFVLDWLSQSTDQERIRTVCSKSRAIVIEIVLSGMLKLQHNECA